MICKRKHHLFDQQYLLYLTESYIRIGKDEHTIKYEIEISLQTQLEWKLNQLQEYKGFTVNIDEIEKYFLMSNSDCLHLKSNIDGRIAYKNINLFYSPKSVIGEGSFGKVLLIKSLKNDQFFATKTLRNDLMTSLEDIQDEIVALQSLKHCNIVQLKNIFLHKQYWLLVMEYCEGGSLKEYLREHILEPCEIVTIMTQLLSGLAYIHSMGYVHRDIKPENILFQKMDSISELVISDFGFSVKINDIQTNRPRCGTPGYIAPEIISFDQTNNYNELCDIFSCGVVLYQLITGKNLLKDVSSKFLDQNEQKALLSKIIKMDEIQGEFSSILKWMLEPDPYKRATAADALKFFSELHDLNFFQDACIQPLKHISIHIGKP